MLTALKHLLKNILIPLLFFGGILTAILSIFKKAEWGFFLLVALIPLPNLWYKFHSYPFGKDFIDILYFSIFLGIILQKKGFTKTWNSTIIFILIITSYLSVWNSSLRFSLPMPVTTSSELFRDWKNYAEMMMLYFLALNITKDEEKQKTIFAIIAVVVLMIAVRSYREFIAGSSFDYTKRVGGPFEAVGLGANHLGAFIADYSAALMGMVLLEKENKKRLLYLAAILFSLHPLFYSYSRGAYLGAFAALAFFGIIKKRSLLILVVTVVLAWNTLLPASVVDRISMTETESGELEGSSAERLVLWEHAIDLFKDNPVFGIGFGGFGFTVPEGTLTDTHNFYVKTLSEQGAIGSFLLLSVILMSFRSGWKLFRTGLSNFHRGLGLGFMGTVVALTITNIFGDRWSYFVLGGYFWILWGLVDRGILITAVHGAPVKKQPGEKNIEPQPLKGAAGFSK